MKFIPVRITPLPPREGQPVMPTKSPITHRTVSLAVLVATIAFAIIAGLGVLVAVAGGIQWGTGDAGAAAAITVVIALIAAALTGGFVLDEAR